MTHDERTPWDDSIEIERARCAWAEHADEARWAASSAVVTRIVNSTFDAARDYSDGDAIRVHRAIAGNDDLDVPVDVATRTRRSVLAFATEPAHRRDVRHGELAAYHDRRVRETLTTALDTTADALMHGLTPTWLDWPAVLGAAYAHALLSGGDWRSARDRLADGVRRLVTSRVLAATRCAA